MKRLKELRARLQVGIPNEAKAIRENVEREARELTAEESGKLVALKDEKEKLLAEQASLDALSDLERVPAGQRSDVALTGTVVSVGDDLATLKPFESFGHYMQAVAAAAAPNSETFGEFRGGTLDPRLLPLQAGPTGLGSTVPSGGGFLVQKQYSDALLNRAKDDSTLMSLVNEIPIGPDFDGAEAPYFDETSRASGSRLGGVQVFRRGEADTVTATKPKLGKWACELEDMMAIAYATNRLVRDASALGRILEVAFGSEFAFKFDDEAINGNGVGQMLGILNSPALVTISKESGQAANTFVAANAAKMFAAVPPRLRKDCVWLFNSEVIPQLLQMSIANMPVYTPPGGLADAPFGRLLGKPIYEMEQCSALSALGDAFFINPREYSIVTKGGVQFAESMHVRFIYGENTYRWLLPINGQPNWKTAVAKYKGSGSWSPFITLQAR